MNPILDRHQIASAESDGLRLNSESVARTDSPPPPPVSLAATGVSDEVLSNLTLKLAYTVPRFTSEWAARTLCLPLPIVAELLEQLRSDRMVEVLGESGPFSLTFAITGRGRETATRLFEISGYVGPAPVSLDAYRKNLSQQFAALPKPSHARVTEALSDVILPKEAVEVAGLAITSRRSLFLNGPPGNGKTTIGHLLHNAEEGELWIPHCIGIESNIIRVYDPQCHEVIAEDGPRIYDKRWLRIKRPFIVVGGELTLEALDLIYSPSLGYYEAPLHFKANGGTFLLDDFGCQRVEPQEMLNRWIIPLERQVDYLTLQTGQQLEVPFRQMLIVSTNINPDSIMSPAFLRRMGYRLRLDNPTPERYSQIFRRYAQGADVEVSDEVLGELIERYHHEDRIMRCCEPRDLIERSRDICAYHQQPFRLSADVLHTAWAGYFGNQEVAKS